jgi:hypothetical protein
MKDPTPWSNQDTTALERQLLDAAREDCAPEAMKLRMAEALAALPPLAATGSAATQPVAGFARARLLFSHPSVWGSLSAAILAGAVGWRALSHSSAAPGDRARAESTAQLAARPVEPLHDAPQPLVAGTLAEPLPVATAIAAAPPSRREPTAEPVLHLREELALLDATRTALASRDTTRALRLLDQHAEQFAHGRLTPEAEALRIDALIQRGATERAEKLSRRFLERHPTHPLAAHIASVAARR